MIRQFLKDENDKYSSTRLVLFLCTLVFGTAAFMDIFTVVEINSQIYNIIQTIFGVGLGGTAARAGIKNWRQDAGIHKVNS